MIENITYTEIPSEFIDTRRSQFRGCTFFKLPFITNNCEFKNCIFHINKSTRFENCVFHNVNINSTKILFVENSTLVETEIVAKGTCISHSSIHRCKLQKNVDIRLSEVFDCDFEKSLTLELSDVVNCTLNNEKIHTIDHSCFHAVYMTETYTKIGCTLFKTSFIRKKLNDPVVHAALKSEFEIPDTQFRYLKLNLEILLELLDVHY